MPTRLEWSMYLWLVYIGKARFHVHLDFDIYKHLRKNLAVKRQVDIFVNLYKVSLFPRRRRGLSPAFARIPA